MICSVPPWSLGNLLTQERCANLYGGLLTASIANVVLGLCVIAVLLPDQSDGSLWAWLAVLILVQGARLVLWQRYKAAFREAHRVTASRWLGWFRSGALATGLVWSVAAVGLFPKDPIDQMFMALSLAGVCAGAISSLATDRYAMLGFAGPILLSFMGRLFWEGGELALMLGFLVALFSVFIVLGVQRFETQFQSNIRLRQEAQERQRNLERQQSLIEVIERVQSRFIRVSERSSAFHELLDDMLMLTESEFGFIGELRLDSVAGPYLKTYALTHIAWDETTRALYEGQARDGVGLQNLAAWVTDSLMSGTPILSSDSVVDPHGVGFPAGHPPLQSFMGLPVYHENQLVAMVGVANRSAGYGAELVEFLQPLLTALGQMVQARREQQKHREVQAEVSRLSRVASETTNAVIITDAQGSIEWVNSGFTRLTGYEPTEVIGHRPGQLLQGPDTDPETVSLMRKAIEQAVAFDVEVANRSKNGKSYWVHISCNPIRDGEGRLQGFIAVESDVTERQDLLRTKDEFLSTISHELRTPLTVIGGALGMLRSGAMGSWPEPARKLLDLAESNNNRLSTLVNNLLDLQQISSGRWKLNSQIHPLRSLIKDAVEAVHPNILVNGQSRFLLKESNDTDPTVCVDRDRLIQVIKSLLANALRFSPPEAPILIQIDVDQKKARVSVTDQGPGVSATFLPKLFSKFSQADSSDSRAYGGTGLSLALAKNLMEAMNGRIDYETGPTGGASFFVELPLSFHQPLCETEERT